MIISLTDDTPTDQAEVFYLLKYSTACAKIVLSEQMLTTASVQKWCEETRARVTALSGEVALRYNSAPLFEHYCRTAELFGVKLQDETLSQAAFLHGVWDAALLKTWSDLPDEVRDIIDDRARLMAINPDDADVPAHLIADLFPKLKSPRSVVLLVIEQLDHLDPDGAFREFTIEFARGTPVPPAPPRVIRQPSFRSLDDQIAYLRSMVTTGARYCGLWLERNCAEDLNLYFTEPDLFTAVAAFTREHQVIQETQRRASLIRGVLSSPYEVFWEWHHIASLARKLSRDRENWQHRLKVSGMVTVVCPDVETCYRAIASLHLNSALQRHTHEVQDTLGAPSITGYEAFHTVLASRTALTEGAIRVRVIPETAQKRRWTPVALRELAGLRNDSAKSERKDLVVFAPDSREVRLPRGSVVLNFCYEIHSHFVALARGALVNRAPVDLLYPLRDGDVVHVDVGDDPRPLPLNWRQAVPPETAAKISKAFRACYQPQQIQRGREILRQRLSILRPVDALDEASLESILDESIRQLLQAGVLTGRPGVSRWLRKFGAAVVTEHEAQFAGILNAICAQLNKNDGFGRDSLAVPYQLNGAFDHIDICPICRPSMGHAVVGVIENRRLVIHVAHRKCSQNGLAIEWRRRYSRGEFFVIEMVNRVGIASDILRTVAARGVDIIEHVGASLGPGWAVLRLHINAGRPETSRCIEQDLCRIPGVLRVVPPDQPIVPVLEGALPPRTYDGSVLSRRAAPFICGYPVPDENFYGRQEELQRLREAYQLAVVPGAPRGAIAFVQGPFKVGKTSLVDMFVRELQRSEYKCTTISLTAREMENWDDLSFRLHDRLLASIAVAAPNNGLPRPNENATLPELIEFFPRRLERPLVIFIDEAVHLLQIAARDGQDKLVVDFADSVKNTPGVLLICAGPEANVFDLPDSLTSTLRAAHQVRLLPLNWQEVKQLLRAEKLSSRGVRIRVQDFLAKRICNYTGGNPYWCNQIAETMFRLHSGQIGMRSYRPADFEEARIDLAAQLKPFKDRIAELDVLGLPSGVTMHFLATLAACFSQGRGRDRGLTTEQVHAVVRQRYTEVKDETITLMLMRLRSRGSLRLVSSSSDAVWQIECQALADHLLAFVPLSAQGASK